MAITRRQVLAATAAMGAAVAVGTTVTGIRWYDQPPGAELKTLSDAEHTFVQAMAEAWMPPGGEPALSGSEAHCGRFVDDVLVTMNEESRSLLKVLIHALDERTVPLHLSTFKALPLQTRTEVLRGWLESSLYAERQAVQALLALVAFGYTTHPEVSKVFSPLFGCGYGR